MAAKDLVMEIGSLDGLSFSIRWSDPDSQGTADEATRGWLGSAIGETQVWRDGSNEPEPTQPWSLVEVLEHLAWAWPYLKLEELDPLGTGVRPDLSRLEAIRRWEDVAEATRIEEQRLLNAYEECHDLSRAFQGLWLPSLWVQREGASCWLVSYPLVARRPFGEVIETLEALGDAIAARVGGLDDERARVASDGWDRKDELLVEQQIAIATGLDVATLERASGGQSLARVFEYEGDYVPGEVLVAARMVAGAIDPRDLGGLLGRLRRMKATSSRKADGLADEAASVLDPMSGLPPYDQGYGLARWLRREKLALKDEQKFDPEDFLRKTLGVKLEQFQLDSRMLDAVCVWGPRHGPAVLLNSKGKHSQGVAGRRATLAHEICHVLLDRRGALPFAEVLGGRVPRSIEARARAFAAEMLIPKTIAGKAFASAEEPVKVMTRLRRHYGASAEIIAWQAGNSDASLSPIANRYLQSCVSMPSRFRTAAGA